MQAEYLVDTLPIGRKSRLVRIYGAKTDHNAVLFKQGQDNILAPHIASGRIEVVHEDWAENWKPEMAKKIANAAITNHGATFDARSWLPTTGRPAGRFRHCSKKA